MTLAREAVDARNQHLNQAMDLYMKHQYLPDDVQVRTRACSRLCIYNSYILYAVANWETEKFLDNSMLL